MSIYPSGPQDNTKYTLTAPDGSICTFNDPTDANYVGQAWFTGLEFSEIREAIEDRSGDDGGIQGRNYLGPRPITVTVTIVPTSTTDRAQKFQKLKRAINARKADGQLKFTPDGSGGLEMGCRYRITQPPRADDKKKWVTTWQFALKAADPYLYGTTLRSQSGITASTTITNQGDGESAPSISMTATAAGGARINNLTTGESLSVTVPSGLADVYSYSSQFGSAGTGNGQFAAPLGVAVDGSGNIYVADTANNRVQKFNSAGVYQSQFGTFGTGNGQFRSPSGIAFDSSGNIFVVDIGNNRVQKFNSAGVYQAQFGTFGSGASNFASPVDIAIDSSNNMYITDQFNHRVQKWSAALANTGTFGTVGSGNNNLREPYGLDTDSTNVWIADHGNNRIHKISTGMAHVANYGIQGSGVTVGAPAQFTDAFGVQLDGSGNFFVSDWSLSRILKVDGSGNLLSVIGSAGSGNGQLQSPALLARTGSTIVAVDYNNNRIQLFGQVSTFDFDFAATTIIAGGINYYNILNVPQSSWWRLQPGDNSIQVASAGATISAASISWRDAWL